MTHAGTTACRSSESIVSANGSSVIVTGGADLLDLQIVEGVRILIPADFIDELDS